MENKIGSSLQSTVAELQKQLQKKQTFEAAADALTGLITDRHASATPSEQNSELVQLVESDGSLLPPCMMNLIYSTGGSEKVYAAVCRTATLLTTRFTGTGFWMSGLRLFEAALAAVTRPEERKKITSFIKQAHDILGEQLEREENTPSTMGAGTSSERFLFEGQLTVGAEPPLPQWLQRQRALINSMREQVLVERDSAEQGTESMTEAEIPSPSAGQLAEELVGLLQSVHGPTQSNAAENEALEEAIRATLQEIGSLPQGPPPASKEEVEKLPKIEVTQAVLDKFGEGTACSVCREDMVIGDTMQEMPCKHNFHPDCLKPWLDQHNSCPICRFEMPTDDHDYERKKERDREAEEERKGSENALRGGEFMYI